MHKSKTASGISKRLLALVLVLSMFASLFVGGVSAAGNDLSGHWAEKKITSWIDRGLINGYSDGSFRPDGQITRGEFCAIVNRVFGFTGAKNISFTDVPASHWAYDDVAIAVKTGYMTGMGDGTFGVDKPISRQEMAVVIARLLGLSAASGNGGYSDAASFASWAAGSIAALAEEGIMNGYPDGTFRPTRSVTRAEAVTALDQLDEGSISLIPGKDEVPEEDDEPEDDDRYEDDDDDDSWTGGGSGSGIGGGSSVDNNTSTRPDPDPDSSDKSPIAAPKPPADAPYSDFIVYEGTPQAHIVLMEDATGLEKQAADELQAHVELVSGVTLPIDIMDPADFEFSASYEPGIISAAGKGYYPVEIILRNPSSEARVVTLETVADGEAEPTITVRGDEGNDTAVTVQGNSQVQLSAMVTVEDAEAFGLCDIDLQIKDGSEVLDTLSITVAGLGNNVSDGGFETADNSWTGGEVSNLTARTGAASYKFSSEAVKGEAMPLRDGGLYHLSFYAKAEKENTTVYGKVTDLDADGNVLDVPMSLYTRAAVKKGVWTYVEMTFTANSAADAAYAASQLSLVAKGGDVWVDDVNLVDCGSTPVNTLKGDFEEYNPNGGDSKFEDWFTHTVMTNETEDVYAGAQAAKLPNWGGMLGMGSLTGTATTPDATYTFSVWLKAPSGSGSFTWQWQPVIDGYTQPATATTLQVTDQWERYTIEFHTPYEEAGHLFNGCYFNFRWSGDLLMDHAAVQITSAADGLTPAPARMSMTTYDFADGLQGWTGAAADSTTGSDALGAMKISASGEASLGKLQLVPGNLYALGFWAKAASKDAVLYAKVSDYNASGAALATPMSAYNRMGIGAGNWTYHEIRFLANTSGDIGYTSSVLSLVNTSAGNIWIDDVTLIDTAASPDIEKDNPDFETFSGSDFPGYFFHTQDSQETADVYTGTQAAKVASSGHNLAFYGINGDGFLFTKPGQTYTFSVWMKSATPDAWVRFSTAEYVNNAPNGHNETHEFQLTDQWERYEFTYETAPLTDDIWKFNGSYMNFKYYGDILFDHCTLYVSTAVSELDMGSSEASGTKYDFETGLQGWTGGTISTSAARNGKQSLQIDGETTATFGAPQMLRGGNLYRVGLWVKTDSMGTPELQLKVRDLDADGNVLTVPASINTRILPGSSWGYYEFHFIANFSGANDYAASVLELVCKSRGSIYVDDVVLINTAVVAANEASNSSLEEASKGNWFLGTKGRHGEVTKETAYAGSQSAKIYAGRLGYEGFHMAEPKTTYTLSFWAKGATGSGESVRWETSEYTNSVSNGHKENHTFNLTGEWEFYSFEYTSSPRTSDITVFNGTYLNFVPGGTVYMDDLTIVKTGFIDDLGDEIFEAPEAEEPEVPGTGEDGGEQEAPLGEMPAMIAPAPSGMNIIIATTDSYPELDSYFPEDVDYLGDSDGFAVRQRGGALYIFGTKAKGALNGAYDFIEKNLGVIWFRADDTAYDPMTTIDPDYTDYAEKSPFVIRGWHLCGSGDKGESHSDPDTEIMMTRNKLNAKLAEEVNWTLWPWQRSIGISNYTMGHNVGILMRSSPLYDPEDDEYWPTDAEGNRHPQAGDDVHCEINYFSDKAAAAVLDSLIRKIEANPEITHIGCGQNDSSNYYVKGVSDQPFEYAPGQFVYPEDRNYMSTVLFTFINKIAEPIKELYPHITLTTYAYGWSTPAPAMEVCDNVQILFCHTSENLQHAFHESGVNDPNYPIYSDLIDWADRGANIVVYNYFGTFFADDLYARPVYETIQKNLQFYAEGGYAGVLPEGQTDATASAPSWAMNHMTYWLYHKLAWNPYIDLEAEIEYFCNKVYGPEAGPYMREYYRVIKECFDETEFPIHYTTMMPDYLNNFILNQGAKQLDMQEAITNAYKAAEGVYKDRVEYIYNAYTDVVAASSTLKIQDASAKYTNADKSVILNTTDFSDPIWSDTAVLDNFYHNQWLKPVTGAHAQVRLLWDEDYIYVGYEMFDDTIGNIMTSPTYGSSNQSWWNSKSDDTETYLTLDTTLNDYYAYFVNPSDLNFRYMYQNGYRRHDATPCDWTFNSEIIDVEGTENDKWVVIKAISWESLGLKGDATSDTEVYGYFYREYHNESGESNQIAWNGAAVWSNKALREIELLP